MRTMWHRCERPIFKGCWLLVPAAFMTDANENLKVALKSRSGCAVADELFDSDMACMELCVTTRKHTYLEGKKVSQ